MTIIHCVVAVRVPGLFLQTRCGLEFPDYGIPVNSVLRRPIAVDAVWNAEETYSVSVDNVVNCLICHV